MTISLEVWSTALRNSSQTSWCRHWWFSSRYVFTSFLSGLHSGVVPSAGFHSPPSAVITNDASLNTLPIYCFSLHNLENHNLHDQAIGNMSCTTQNQKRDGCFCSLCGRRGVSSVISGIVAVLTHAIFLLIARCFLEWMHHPGNVFWFRNGTQLPQMKGLYLKVQFCFGFLIWEM